MALACSREQQARCTQDKRKIPAKAAAVVIIRFPLGTECSISYSNSAAS